MKRRIKIAFFVALGVFVCCLFASNPLNARANANEEDLVNELEENVHMQLRNLDFSELEKILEEFSGAQTGLFGASSFEGKVKQILSGDFLISYESFFSGILTIMFGEVLAFVPLCAMIIGIALLCGMLANIRSKTASDSVKNVIFFACFGVIVIIVLTVVVKLLNSSSKAVQSMQAQMNMAFPLLLTLMTAIGGQASTAVYQPAVAVLTTVISELMTKIILPIFVFTLVFNVVGSMSSATKLEKMSSFLSSMSKWIIGIVFTVFIAFLSIQGITAATFDGVSIRTAKYAISHYIPLIGGYLSEGFNLILSSSLLIKNAVGVTGLLMLVVTVLAPVLQIAACNMGLKLTAAILEPIADKRISNFISSVSKSLNMLIVVILAVAFMYFITVMLIISTGNQLLGGFDGCTFFTFVNFFAHVAK